MKILFFTSYSLLYGANRSLLTLMCYLKGHGYDVKIYLPRHGEYEKALIENGISFEVIRMFNQFLYYKPIKKYAILPLLILWDILVFPYLLFKIKKYNPSLIYSNAATECLGGIAARCLHIKHIWHIREFMDRDYNAHFYLGNKARKKFIEKSDGLIFVSQAVADAMLLGNELKKNQKVIYNGVSIPDREITVKDTHGIMPKLGIVGVLCDGKGQKKAVKLLPRIIEKYPEVQLHLFGDRESAYKDSLIDVAKETGVYNHLVFHGFQRSLDNIYPEMDILLMFSVSEGFGRVTIEAMNYGIPVIGFDNAGTSEIIESGYDGLLFHSDEEFIDCLDRIMSDKVLFNNIRMAAYKKVKEQFTIQRYCSEVKAFIETTVN